MAYTREVLHRPGFIKEEGENAQYGQHCLELMFVVKNGRGAVVLQLMTGWYPFQGAIGESTHYNARLAWHLPLPRNPLDYADQIPHDCGIIGQKCIGSSTADWENRWMKLLCYSSREHFWTTLERFHDHICNGKEWNKEMCTPDMLYLSDRKEETNDPAF